MSEELKSKFETAEEVFNRYVNVAQVGTEVAQNIVDAMVTYADQFRKADEWVSVVNSGAIPPKENTWYQCAKYSRQLEEYVIMLLPYQFDKVRGFIAYTENHTDNSVTHYRELPTPPNQ